MSEDQDLLARIGQLAGQINQRKYSPYPPPSQSSVNTGYRRGSSRIRGRGGRQYYPSHRNHTLVIDNTIATNNSPENDSEVNADQNGQSGSHTPKSGNWIATKRNTAVQLINPAIYDQETQARAKAMEETRKAKALYREEREKLKLNTYIRNHSIENSNSPQTTTPPNQFYIEDIPFRVTKGGRKIVRVSSASRQYVLRSFLKSSPSTEDEASAKRTPKSAVVGGVRFVRSKNGNLYRAQVVDQKRWVLGRCSDSEHLYLD
ncbi:MAG: hypothetical protein M1834_005111 [Cirrosporium novae-zelandiae]|nr:MAG: hypothetical protein M1834_005111 [Cirrosporium novae-zelandiae]